MNRYCASVSLRIDRHVSVRLSPHRAGRAHIVLSVDDSSESHSIHIDTEDDRLRLLRALATDDEIVRLGCAEEVAHV